MEVLFSIQSRLFAVFRDADGSTHWSDYDGKKVSDLQTRADLESPFMYFVPSIAISGLTFYTGDKLAAWKGNAFVGSMMEGRTKWTRPVWVRVITPPSPTSR